MDYKTHPTSREELRKMAKLIRKIFGCQEKYYFDVVDAFERTPQKFTQITCAVLDDAEMENGVPARCTPDMNGHYLIEVKNSVYEGAVAGKGGYRAHILHEICHAILCLFGFTPILHCAYKNKELQPYESMEWQAKALCGEVMIPYEKCKNYSLDKIISKTQSSTEQARYFINKVVKGDD